MALCCCISGIANKLLNEGEELGLHGWWQYGDVERNVKKLLLEVGVADGGVVVEVGVMVVVLCED